MKPSLLVGIFLTALAALMVFVIFFSPYAFLPAGPSEINLLFP